MKWSGMIQGVLGLVQYLVRTPPAHRGLEADIAQGKLLITTAIIFVNC